MKLWVKSIAGLASVGIASGAIVGGIALFNTKNNKVKGATFSSSSPLDTHFPDSFKGKSIQDLEPSDLTVYFTKMNAQLDDKFATYIYNDVADPKGADNGTVQVQGQTASFDSFYKSYIKQYNDTPEQVVKFGPAVFQNEYLDAVSPKEFVEYVVWFLKNVSWGGDLAALEHFSLKRGVKTAGSSIILGEHVNTNSEKTTIEFYPDAFFGSLPMYSQENGQGQKIDNLLMKISDVNSTLLTLDDVKQLVQNKRSIESNAAIQAFNIRSVLPVKNIIRDGKEQMGYEVYTDIYPGLIDDVLNRFPYLTKPLEGPHVVADTDAGIQSTENGDLYWNYKLIENGSYRGIDTNSRIPFLAVLKAADPNFKGVGINWLKYVGQHEYGHHTTLSDEQDASENAVYAGASSSQKAINQGKLYSVDALNKYLQARSRTLSIDAANKPNGTSDLTEIIKFVEDGVPEADKDAYGSIDDNDTSAAILNDRRRAMHITTDELAQAALNRGNGVSLYDLMIENAWDGYSATINPGFEADALYYKYTWEKNAAGKYVPTRAQLTPGGMIQRDNGNLNSSADAINAYDPTDPIIKNQVFLKDAAGTPIETDVPILDKTTNNPTNATGQFIIQRWDDSVKTPVRYVVNSGQYGTYYSIKPYDGPDDGKPNKTIQPTGTNPNPTNPQPPTTRTTVVQTRADDGSLVPIVSNNASGTDIFAAEQKISTFLSSIVSTYEMNGWDKSSTLVYGANILSRIYYQGALQEDSTSAKNKADEIDQSAASWVNNREVGLENAVSSGQPLDWSLQNVSTMWKGTDTANAQLANFGDAIFTATTQGIGFGAYNGMGAFFNIDGSFVTSMPTGDFSPWGPTSSGRGDATWNQFSRDMTPTSIARVGNFEFINKTNPTWYLGTNYNTTDQRYYYYWFDPANDGPAKDANGNLLNAIKTEDLTKTENDSVMYFNGLNLDSAYTITKTNAAEFKDYQFDKNMYSATLEGWKKPATPSAPLADNGMRLSKYYDIFTADPFSDFEYSKTSGSTVYTNAFLAKIFDLAKVQAANPKASPEDIQSFLTAMLNAQSQITLKDDLKNLNDFKVAENSSLWAFLTQGKNQTSADNSYFSKGMGLRSVLNSYPKTSDLEVIVDAMKAKKIEWLTNSTYGARLGLSSDKLSFSEFALLAGLWHFNNRSQSQPNPSLDLFYQLNVAPSPDVVDYLTRRNQDTLDDIFSDYTYNVPEMTNRDYLQMTYMPDNKTPLTGTPDWFGEITEARSGWEYYIDGSATKKYLTSSLMTTRNDADSGQQVTDFKNLADGIAKAFHFTIDAIGEVVMDNDPNTGDAYPMVSAGIKAAASLNNWTNFVSPSYLGQTMSESNGFFKDDFLRRAAGHDAYEVDSNGNETGKFLGSWIDEKFYPIKDWNTSRSVLSTTPTETLENMLIADAQGNILARKAPDKTAWIVETGSAWNGYTIDIEHPYSPVDTYYDSAKPGITVQNNTYPVKDASGKVVAAICVENNHVYQIASAADLNPDATKRTTVAYVVGSAFNKSVDNKIIVDGSKIFGRMGSSTIYNWAADQIKIDGTLDQTKFTKIQALHGAEMYGLDNKPVQDQTIRIKDLQGNPVTDRARAVWMWLLEQKGIADYADQDGKKLTPQEWVQAGSLGTGRNIDGLWRSPVRDASYLWGYIPKQFTSQNIDGTSTGVTRHASDISFIEFKDVATGATKYLPVAIGENNLFYYTDRGIVNPDGSQGTKRTLDDEGYTSWTSDFAAIGSYYDGLLLSGHNYVMSFVGANKEFITKVDLGTRTIICENGKPEGKAPNYIKENESGETVIYVNDQFNS